MLQQFLRVTPPHESQPTAYERAWRPVGAKAFDLADVKEETRPVVQATWPTFELL